MDNPNSGGWGGRWGVLFETPQRSHPSPLEFERDIPS